ncbi:unnamed protein product, partial [marine sediment metagenome]
MVTKAAPMEVLNGALLSDSHIAGNRGSPYLKVAQAGEDRVEWLTLIEEALVLLGIRTTGVKITNRINYYTRKQYRHCELLSRAHPMIKALRAEWYPNGQKRVPKNLALTPGVVAHWFIGDGSSTRLKGREHYVKSAFCTQGFPDDDVYLLASMLLDELDIRANCNRVSRINGEGLVLNISAVDEVNKLMDAVEPYMLPSFIYKIKRAFWERTEMLQQA